MLTGATGFVGRHASVALKARGWEVVHATRNRERAAQVGWLYADVEKPETLAPALRGCDAAVYLIHSIDESDSYPEREANSAIAFRRAAEAANLRRIVYLGGVQPKLNPSRHLLSRVRTGEILRGGTISTIEIRCGLIVGAGGSSWIIVRDLAARLPAMLLPRWLDNVSWPVWIGDVCVAIALGLEFDKPGSACFDLPGAERVTHEALLRRVAAGYDKRPPLVHVPLISPRLSSYWIALVTRADFSLARELVEGLQSDLEPSQPILWNQVESVRPTPLDEAIALSLRDAHVANPPSTELRQRIEARMKALP